MNYFQVARARALLYNLNPLVLVKENLAAVSLVRKGVKVERPEAQRVGGSEEQAAATRLMPRLIVRLCVCRTLATCKTIPHALTSFLSAHYLQHKSLCWLH